MRDKRISKSETAEEGLFIGRNAVMELLKSGRTIDKIYIKNESNEGVLAVIRAKASEKRVPIVETDSRRLDRLAEGGVHQGVIAVAAETDYLSVDELLALTAERFTS